jgi:putative oxidoreductase
MIQKFFAPGKNSASANIALLVLRLWIGLEMLLVHGIDKFANFNTASLALAVFAEVFMSSAIVFGLFTRLGAVILIIDMTVAFIFVHKSALSGEHSGELAFLYLMAYVVLFLAGPGRISADKIFFGKSAAGPSR